MKKTQTMNWISGLFGILFSFIGVVNIFWGNDTVFGVFLLLLSLLYYPPILRILEQKIGYKLPGFAKIVLAIFILWASLGVGELFSKIDMILQ
jgi:hypothetical protein